MSERVDFAGAKLIGVLGVIAGTAIAIGVPWVVLSTAGPGMLGGFAITLLCVLGVAGGTSLAIISAFFSIVVPRRVGTK